MPSLQLLQEEKQQPGFWTFSYYQSFFDVDTSQVRPGKLVVWDLRSHGGPATVPEPFLDTRMLVMPRR